MSTLGEDLLNVSQPQTRPTSSHASDSGIETDVGSIHSGLQDTTLEIVAKRIRLKLLPKDDDPDHPPRFLPLDDLESILSKEVVEEILCKAKGLGITGAEAVEIRKQICGNRSEPRRMKILATLILIGKVRYIRSFLDQDVWDNQLPLIHDLNEPVFQGWKPNHVESFRERQYRVVAPVFDFTTMNHGEFRLKAPMPFLERLEWKSRGAHGSISKVRIHPEHQCWNADLASEYDRSCFAIKKFEHRDRFEKEKEALVRFSCPNKGHKHLVRLLSSYQLGDEYFFMIFPWAQGNLAEFWKKPRVPSSRDDSYWLIQQCLGVASGLCKVHKDDSWPPGYGSDGDSSQASPRNRGRHGDIKPENILWFKEAEASRGHLVVADFTLMRFHSMDTVNYTEANQVDFSQTYCPPEVERPSQTIANQKYDIWTLGCVYLEFITWYLIGYDAIRGDYFKTPGGKCLESFTILRSKTDKKHGMPTDRFFTPNDGSGAKVKDSVKKWIKMLHGNPDCSPAIHDFLDLIEERMLVASPGDRCWMADVHAELNEISERCQLNGQYCHEGDPRRTSNDDNFPPEFTKQESTNYRKLDQTSCSTLASSLDTEANPDYNVLRGAFADVIPGGHQPSGPMTKGDAQPSTLGDQPTGDGKRKADQHLSPPDVLYSSKRRMPSDQSFRSDSSRSLDPADLLPGVDLQLAQDAETQSQRLTPATSCRPDSSDGASFRTIEKETVVNLEYRDGVDMTNAGGKHPDYSPQVCSQPPQESSGGPDDDLGINSSESLGPECEPRDLGARDQDESDCQRGSSVRQRVKLLLKRRNEGVRHGMRRILKKIWTKISR
ncbi:hypothetical protein CEP53_008632 [Fusarium sp. AF-6]|nr:hypothetical protein CEP53_008632 [Fusarium sp. AF-6]